jgi:hypothetical protein
MGDSGGLMGKLTLTVNEEKTRICKVPEGRFTFHVSIRCSTRRYKPGTEVIGRNERIGARRRRISFTVPPHFHVLAFEQRLVYPE